MKRIFDFLVSFTGLIILTPLLLSVILILVFLDGRPVFFSQKRMGKNYQTFRILKFRTMRSKQNNQDFSITTRDDPRITSIGRFLRKSKLDELPQLFNVLRGEMSLVGPRPEVPDIFDQYPNDLRALMASVRPGITDFASIEFLDENELLGNGEDPEKTYLLKILPRKELYIRKYIEEQSFCTDVKLILRTLIVTLTKTNTPDH